MTFEDKDAEYNEADASGETTERAQAWIVRLASGETTEAELAELKAWLAASAAHRAAFAEARSFWHRLSALRPAFEDAERAAESPSRPSGRPCRRLRWGISGALALAACLLLVLFLPQLTTALRADYASGAAAVLRVTLADGSRVTLDRNSALAVDFDGTARRVELLQGQAFFDVRRDPARPFRVVAGRGTAEAVGTAYAVRRGETAVRVAVTEGRVAVTAGPVPAAPVTLRAGQALRYGAAGALGDAFALEAGRALAWRDGRVIFQARPLREALAELERYHPGRILLLAEGRFRPVSGVIDLDRLDQGLAALAATHGLRVTRLTPYLTVLR